MKLMGWLKQQLNIFVSPRSHRYSGRRAHRRDYHLKKRRRHVDVDSLADAQPDAQSEVKPITDDSDGLISASTHTPDPVETLTIQSHVTFFYLDEDDNPIKAPDILSGTTGERFSLQLPHFDNYYLVTITNFSTYFEETDQRVTLRYALKEGLPVLVYYLDIDTGEFRHQVTIHSGKLGQSFDVEEKSIPGYRIINRTGKTYGLFDKQIHRIIFYYRRKDWQTVQQVEYYVRLKKRHVVFSEPNGHKLQSSLPANAVIKIFARIETTDHQSWLNIGGFEWIKNTDLEPSDPPTNHFLPPITKTSRNPVMWFGTIDFVSDQSVDVFDKPYGSRVGQLMAGSRVSIKARIIDDQGLIWYELVDQSIIFNKYVIVDS